MATITDFGRTVTLTEGDDVYTVPFDNMLVNTIYGLGGDDVIRGGNAGGIIYGGDGNDTLSSGNQDTTLVGGLGANTYSGGIAALNGNAGDYTCYDAGTAGTYLYARNGSGDQHLFVQTVVFLDGTTVAANRLSQVVTPVGAAGGSVQVAAISGNGRYDGGVGMGDVLVLNGNVGDYTLLRTSRYGYRFNINPEGDFALTAINGSGETLIDPQIDTVRFQNGQSLALHDLPAYVAGNAALPYGGSQDDLLFQTRASGYEYFAGGAGTDTVYLKGNIGDYVVKATDAYSTAYLNFTGNDVVVHPSAVALTATNGSGELVVDRSVETVSFANGDTLTLDDVLARLAHDPATAAETLYLLPDGSPFGGIAQYAPGTSGADRVLLNGNVGDYLLSRSGGDFVLTGPGQVHIGQSVETIQFANGQYLSLRDVPAYVKGDPTYTTGFVFDDLLFAGPTGDQYIFGGDGIDQAYVKETVADFTLMSVNLPGTASEPPIDGYVLRARDGSGDLYIDRSTETAHFADGQYLAFQDLPAYIVRDAGLLS